MNKPKVFIVLAVAVLMVISAGCKAGTWKDGTVHGSGTGHNGPIKVQVDIKKGKISGVKAVEHEETPGIGDSAMEELSGKIIAAQSTKVDAVAGATVTSEGFLQAVDEALTLAAKR